jgi:carboxymethylenebutenolidase
MNASMQAYRLMKSIKKAGVKYELIIYPGVNHAFHNDTSEARYDANAALHAWKKTLDFFEVNLK